MLILARKPGQSILIGDNIEITVCQVNGNQVKLGIAAPKEVSVDREEIRLKKSMDGVDGSISQHG